VQVRLWPSTTTCHGHLPKDEALKQSVGGGRSAPRGDGSGRRRDFVPARARPSQLATAFLQGTHRRLGLMPNSDGF